jgi:hypothetical protein
VGRVVMEMEVTWAQRNIWSHSGKYHQGHQFSMQAIPCMTRYATSPAHGSAGVLASPGSKNFVNSRWCWWGCWW